MGELQRGAASRGFRRARRYARRIRICPVRVARRKLARKRVRILVRQLERIYRHRPRQQQLAIAVKFQQPSALFLDHGRHSRIGDHAPAVFAPKMFAVFRRRASALENLHANPFFRRHDARKHEKVFRAWSLVHCGETRTPMRASFPDVKRNRLLESLETHGPPIQQTRGGNSKSWCRS